MDILEQLARGLQDELPGQAAQFKLSHAIRRNDLSVPENVRKAGVMALFFPKTKTGWHLALIERASHDKDQHGGQISFPGGKHEPTDTSLAMTAFREVEEEIGVSSTLITMLGALTPLYIPVSNFEVFPFVGIAQQELSFELQASEVASLVEVPLNELQSRNKLRRTDLPINKNLILKSVPYFHLQERIVWGATAMMLSELLHVMNVDIE